MGISYRLVSVSEENKARRQVVVHNFPVEHVFADIADQLVGKRCCLLHQGNDSVQCHEYGKDVGTAADILVSGFPCQAYSKARKGRFTNKLPSAHEKGNISEQVVRLMAQSRPRAAIFENVKGFHAGAEDLNAPLDDFLSEVDQSTGGSYLKHVWVLVGVCT